MLGKLWRDVKVSYTPREKQICPLLPLKNWWQFDLKLFVRNDENSRKRRTSAVKDSIKPHLPPTLRQAPKSNPCVSNNRASDCGARGLGFQGQPSSLTGTCRFLLALEPCMDTF